MSERTRRPSLGRGLAALFGETTAHAPDRASQMRQVPIEAIRPSAFQPRRHFADAELDELAQSIREKGVLQPLLVRPLGEADEDASFELIAGERRWRAAQRAGLHEIPVLLRALNDVEVLEIALVENLQREDLSALEEAEAYTRLMREFGRSQAALAEAVGKSRSHVANTIRLLSLPKSVRNLLESGVLSPGHARALLALPDPAPAAEEVVSRGLNVRATEALVRRRVSRPATATATPAPQPRDPNTAALERELTDALGLKVMIANKAGGGTVTIEYSDLDQLDRVLALLRRG
jgi:ParB family chromosome partitioning protein